MSLRHAKQSGLAAAAATAAAAAAAVDLWRKNTTTAQKQGLMKIP